MAHPCHAAQRAHVEATLRSLAFSVAGGDSTATRVPPIINVYNKCDLLASNTETQLKDDPAHLISARSQIGLDPLLEDIERQVLAVTDRRKLQMRVPNGGPEMAWLYKNAAVVSTVADDNNPERLLMQVVISQLTLDKFKREFC